MCGLKVTPWRACAPPGKHQNARRARAISTENPCTVYMYTIYGTLSIDPNKRGSAEIACCEYAGTLLLINRMRVQPSVTRAENTWAISTQAAAPPVGVAARAAKRLKGAVSK